MRFIGRSSIIIKDTIELNLMNLRISLDSRSKVLTTRLGRIVRGGFGTKKLRKLWGK